MSKLLEAKVDAPVILAYIQNSPILYNPEATEPIALKEHGASTETLVALLHHGDELRLRLGQAESAANPPPVAPACDYPSAAAYPAYPYGYPDSSEVPPPLTYYDYTSGWPLTYWASVGNGSPTCTKQEERTSFLSRSQPNHDYRINGYYCGGPASGTAR